MNQILQHMDPDSIIYPESDGKPMADNTKQFRWIQVIHGNIAALYHDHKDVFVAGDLLCYPEEGHPEINTAPDILAVFGRHKGDRGSYRYWEEAGVPITVAFEVLSPSNTVPEMADKFAFYEDHGVEEYYIYDPDNNRLQIFVRRGEVLARVRKVDGYVSPRLGIRFDLSGPDLVIYRPDGQRFRTFEEIQADYAREKQRADLVQHRAARLALLSRKARRGEANAEELAELDRLEEEQLPPTS